MLSMLSYGVKFQEVGVFHGQNINTVVTCEERKGMCNILGVANL